MTDTRAGQSIAEATEANTSPPAAAAQLLAETVGQSAAGVHARAAQTLAEVVAVTGSVPTRAAAVQALIEVIAWIGTAPIPPTPVLTPSQLLSAENKVYLAWSDDRGHSFGNPVGAALGNGGEYRTSLQWQRLGMARDRVFQIQWSCPNATTLQGAWIETTPAKT